MMLMYEFSVLVRREEHVHELGSSLHLSNANRSLELLPADSVNPVLESY